MGFHEVQFPTLLSYGSVGGPGYNTNVITQDSGNEERVARWATARRKYDVAYAIKKPEDLHALITFYLARQGPAFGFRFKDHIDYATTPSGNTVVPNASNTVETVSHTDVILGTGDGTTTQFQLKKIYTSGPSSKTRLLTKPVTGTTKVGLDGVNQVSGWTVDTTTGLVTFSSAPGVGVIVAAGCEFDVPVRFGTEIDLNGLKTGKDDFGYGHAEAVPLVEILDGLTVNEDAYCGGAAEVCIAANYQLSAGYARAYAINASVGGLTVFLPDTTNLPTGGPFFLLMITGSNSVTLKKFGGGSTVATLTAGAAFTLVLALDGGGVKQWYIF